ELVIFPSVVRRVGGRAVVVESMQTPGKHPLRPLRIDDDALKGIGKAIELAEHLPAIVRRIFRGAVEVPKERAMGGGEPSISITIEGHVDNEGRHPNGVPPLIALD